MRQKEPFWKRPKVGFFGSAGAKNMEHALSCANIMGREVAKQEGIVITGACDGVPYAAAMGASEEGGIVIGVSPATNKTEHIERYKMPVEPYMLIFTGFGYKGRNPIAVRSVDIAFFIAGARGSVNEYTIMADEAGDKQVIALLEQSGGETDNYIIPDAKIQKKPIKASIVINADPRLLVAIAFRMLRAINDTTP